MAGAHAVSHPHPDPEGHLTDLTITALRDLRDALTGTDIGRALDAILEPWGEGPTDGE